MENNDSPSPAALPAFAKRLLQVRIAYGEMKRYRPYTPVQFARELGISRQRYYKYEQGEIEPPMEILARIRILTGISLCYLIAGAKPGVESVAVDPDRLQLHDRIRMVREILEPAIDRAARALRITVSRWRRMELGRDPIPLELAIEFAHQFGDGNGVGLDFLMRGILAGIAPDLLRELLVRYPRLRAESSAGSEDPHAADSYIPAMRNSARRGNGAAARP